MKEQYNENYKTMMKKIEDTNKWNDIINSWIIRMTIIKYPYYPKQCIDSRQELSKFQWHFHRNRKSNSKICIESQKTLKQYCIAIKIETETNG